MSENIKIQAESAATSTQHSVATLALKRLETNIKDSLSEFASHKTKADAIAKGLSGLGVKIAESLLPFRLPIDTAFIDEVFDALKDGGRNVKSLQRELEIYDYAEMTRKRKALVAAGVTRETENYQGTNVTFIELVPIAAAAAAEPPAPAGEATVEEEEDELEEIPPGSIIPPRRRIGTTKPDAAK